MAPLAAGTRIWLEGKEGRIISSTAEKFAASFDDGLDLRVMRWVDVVSRTASAGAPLPGTLVLRRPP